MAAKPYSDEELEQFRQICHDDSCPQCHTDRRFLATIDADRQQIENLKLDLHIANRVLEIDPATVDLRKRIAELEKQAEIKDSLAEGVMTLAEVYEQLEDAKKRIAELESSVKFNDKIAELHYFKYVELEKIWQRVTGREKTWPDRGALLDWLKTHIAELEAANQRLREGIESLISIIKRGRLTSIGSIKNTYCSQISRNWLDKLAEQALRPQGGKPCEK